MMCTMTTTYVRDVVKAKTPDDLTWVTIRALEALGHSPYLPDPAFTLWALSSAAKARRLELAELYPAQSMTRLMVAMGGFHPGTPSYQGAAA